MIRRATCDDFSLCLPLLHSLYHGDIEPDFRLTFGSYASRDGGVVLLVQHQDQVIGILIGSFQTDIDWEGKTARVDAIIVKEDYRRAGIGARLTQSFIALAAERGCKAIKSRVNVSSQTARGFHESLGFARADTYEYVLDIPVNSPRHEQSSH
jgi:ribosomal protein S18 acetylase RimI-like enzyme